ncbi:hypothetical protein AAHC03_0464 [Spirometra sp. Aus1]
MNQRLEYLQYIRLVKSVNDGDVNMIKRIVSYGVPGIIDYFSAKLGAHPLGFAAKRNDCKILQCLLELGADINGADDNGQNALMYAAENGNVEALELLINMDANINMRNKNGESKLPSHISTVSRICLNVELMLTMSPKMVPCLYILPVKAQ